MQIKDIKNTEENVLENNSQIQNAQLIKQIQQTQIQQQQHIRKQQWRIRQQQQRIKKQQQRLGRINQRLNYIFYALPSFQGNRNPSYQQTQKQLSTSGYATEPAVPEQKITTLQDSRIRAQLIQGGHLGYPLCAIGYLQIYFQKALCYATAFLISQNLALTCAHCIVDRNTKKMECQVYFIPSLHGRMGALQIQAKRVYFPPEYLQDQNFEQWDWAVIDFGKDCRVGRTHGEFTITTQFQLKDSIYIFGYPKDKVEEQNGEKLFYLYGSSKAPLQISNNMIYHDIYTYSGMSGSPIFIKIQQIHYVVGIHTGQVRAGRKRGIKITNQMLNRINCNIMHSRPRAMLQNCGGGFPRMSDYIIYGSDKFQWEKLVIMSFTKCSLTDKDFACFINKQNQNKQSRFSGLKKLDLYANNLLGTTLNHLGSFFPRLEYLRLSHNYIGYSGIKALVQGNLGKLQTFQVLILDSNQLNSEAISFLTSQPSLFISLRILDISSNQIGTIMLGNEMGQKIIFPLLQQLDLSENQFDQMGIFGLCSSQRNFPKLRKLYLQRNNISSKGIQFLAHNNKLFPLLQHLSLSNNQIGDDGVQQLVKSGEMFPNLQILLMVRCQVGTRGLDLLFNSKNLKRLKILDMENNKIKVDGLDVIISHLLEFKNLTRLNLKYNEGIRTPQIKKRLRQLIIINKKWGQQSLTIQVKQYNYNQGSSFQFQYQQLLKQCGIYSNRILFKIG